MEKYFDGYIYNSHWGTRVLMLALPAKVLPLDSVEPFASGDALSVWEKDGRVILKFIWHDENYENWVATEETLSPLLPVREELARGDYRSLYIGWLLSVQGGECAEDQIEPPVPANLSGLSATLGRLVKFLRADRDLLEAAAEGSPSVQPTPETPETRAAWVKSLPNSEKDNALMQLLAGEPTRIAMELRARFSGFRQPSHRPALVSAGRPTNCLLLPRY